MSEIRCQGCQTVIEEINDDLQEINSFMGICPYCGYDPCPPNEE